MAWKPIDIAPRDGRRIVVAYRSPVTEAVFVSVSRWNGGSGWEGEDVHGEVEFVAGQVPFAWTELPES
jgi:hypothetical protein